MFDLTTFLKLIENGILLLKTRNVRREKFFETIIEPIHTSFREMRKNHFDTFTFVEESLSKDNCDVNAIVSEVDRRNSKETSNWEQFGRLQSLAHDAGVQLGEEFATYCRTLKECLDERPAARQPMSIRFYANLTDQLSWIERLLAGKKTLSKQTRVQTIKEIGRLRDKFNSYCERVEASYLQLSASVRV